MESDRPRSARSARDARDARGARAGMRSLADRVGFGGDDDAPARPRGRPFDRHLELPDVDWGRVGGFGAGLALGALIGASAALLMAPHTGEETRHILRRKGRHGARRAAMAWDDLGEELRFARDRAGRNLRRGAARRRMEAEDWLERVKPRGRRRHRDED